MTYQKILIPLDGSELAELALHQVEQIAPSGTHVHVLSIMTEDYMLETGINLAYVMNTGYSFSNEVPPGLQAKEASKVRRQRTEYLHKAADWLLEKGYVVTVEARPGNAIDEIVQTGASGFDLILM